ncbi:Thioredoxin-disulfide reductase [Thermodesulfobium narugense DSM 14796]|uniref:Thioredoxin-disulfide reductase n=1 Tax=Thermodesulfobium narugense DSM 14796 TaxID=747365 RepID=M1E6N5_9BACT|nr:NAD(P)/FAD-dependent oxidoreductase [Thermodesulfobium narugense]AEE14110.1 Thioredoxin-disulfide reductase [Thermodesulfobium narugense DSM 14796]
MRYDVIILGAGPAGLSAAVYIARANISSLVIGLPDGSRASWAHNIENYLGFPEGISGKEFKERSVAQAKKFGAIILEEEVIAANYSENGGYYVETNKENRFEADYLILALGLNVKPSGVKNEVEYIGKGVSYCSTCDGFFYKDRPVVVIGNKDLAARETLDLVEFASKITLISHAKDFEISENFLNKLKQNNVELRTGKAIEVLGDGEKVTGVLLDDGSKITTDGVFFALGNMGSLDIARFLGLEINEKTKSIVVDRSMKTNIPGIYAAGDCTGEPYQVSTAVGEGAIAALEIIHEIRNRKDRR